MRTMVSLAQNISLWPLDRLVPYERNARTHSPEQVTKIAASITEFGFTNPILVDSKDGIIAGHGRLMAAKELGLPEVPVIVLDHLTDNQRRAYVIADNRLALDAGWDSDILAAELSELFGQGFDLALTGFSDDELNDLIPAVNDNEPDEEHSEPEPVSRGGDPGSESGGLSDRFLVPPFSVLSAREGWWQSRKRAWIGLGIRSEEGRGNETEADAVVSTNVGAVTADSGLAFSLSAQPPAVYDKKQAYEQEINRKLTWAEFYEAKPEVFQVSGTSIFDPVLCEIAYRWFCPPSGTIIDPFAGGSVRGIVAGKLGRQYIGGELRSEQVNANRAQAEKIINDNEPMPVWHCADSRLIDKTAAGVEADLVFSCPPYADLEVYSDDPKDISTLDYPEFRRAYTEIIHKTCRLLKNDRFACFVVGEARDKRGNYYDFVGDTVQAFRDAGLEYYNEAILVTSVGSLPIRAGRVFSTSRKLGKTHQNILVFVKGDGKKAATACGDVDVTIPEGLEHAEA